MQLNWACNCLIALGTPSSCKTRVAGCCVAAKLSSANGSEFYTWQIKYVYINYIMCKCVYKHLKWGCYKLYQNQIPDVLVAFWALRGKCINVFKILCRRSSNSVWFGIRFLLRAKFGRNFSTSIFFICQAVWSYLNKQYKTSWYDVYNSYFVPVS